MSGPGAEHSWESVPLKYLLRRETRRGFPEEQLLSVYRDFGVIPKASRDDNFNKPGSDLQGYLLVQPGNLVVNKMKAWQGSMGVAQHRGIVSPAYYVFRVDGRVDGRFLHHQLRSLPFIAMFHSLSKGIRPNQWDLEADAFGRCEAQLPPRPTQRAIADFLDRKTAAIDGLIAKKQKLLDLLAEKRTALINRAVTKGLDPDVPMKDSGVPWIGEIPAHWEVAELRRHYEVIDCKHRTPEYIDDGYPLVSTGEVKPGRLDLARTNRFIGEADFVDMTGGGRLPVRGNIIYSRNASLGAAAFVDTDRPFSMGQDVVLIRSSVGESCLYLTFLLNSLVGTEQVAAAGVGSTFKRINVAQIRSLWVPCPPIAEAAAIAAYVDKHSRRAERVAEDVQSQIEKLQEYRQALITAAVTGQIDVEAA